MKKTVSYCAAFVLGVLCCSVALRLMYGNQAPSLLTLAGFGSKRAVLAALSASPRPDGEVGRDSMIADAAAKLEPAIVDVHTVGRPDQSDDSSAGNDPFFRRFFGRGGDEAPAPRGAGSGVIISPDGYILTNYHVVENTQTVTVEVGEKGYLATVVGDDPVSDIAVVKIDTEGLRLPVAQLGDSDSLRIGDWAIAIGNPLDIGTTVTLGIISAVNRTGLSAEGHPLNSVIQTDAAINPGNSGGALANIDGQVIGINEAIYSPTGSYVGIGFAIPINAAKKIAYQLIKTGRVIRPYLGVSYAPLKNFPLPVRKQMGIPLTGDSGAVVQQVYPGSPADRAGLANNDVILRANGLPIDDSASLNDIIQKLHVGDNLTLVASRNGRDRTITVTLRERPQTFGETPEQAPEQGQGQYPPDDGSP